jgi:hypothetical protein
MTSFDGERIYYTNQNFTTEEYLYNISIERLTTKLPWLMPAKRFCAFSKNFIMKTDSDIELNSKIM